MRKKYVLFNIATYVGVSLVIVMVVHFFNVLFVYSNGVLIPNDAFFVEGVLFLLIGFLLLLGRGGISFWNVKGAILAATAEALYGAETVGPSETLRRDAWKSKGFIRAGLILLLTGVFMLVIYFLF
jgi:hypothetical protein